MESTETKCILLLSEITHSSDERFEVASKFVLGKIKQNRFCSDVFHPQILPKEIICKASGAVYSPIFDFFWKTLPFTFNFTCNLQKCCICLLLFLCNEDHLGTAICQKNCIGCKSKKKDMMYFCRGKKVNTLATDDPYKIRCKSKSSTCCCPS